MNLQGLVSVMRTKRKMYHFENEEKYNDWLQS